MKFITLQFEKLEEKQQLLRKQHYIKKQSLADILQNSYSSKFRKIHEIS